MDSGVLVPLAVFAGVVIIVGLVNFSGLRDRELQTFESVRRMESEHNLRMADLDRELQRVQQGEKPADQDRK
jgi:hypothetical protein